MTSEELKQALGAFLSADNPQGYVNNVADGLFAIANAIEHLSDAIIDAAGVAAKDTK